MQLKTGRQGIYLPFSHYLYYFPFRFHFPFCGTNIFEWCKKSFFKGGSWSKSPDINSYHGHQCFFYIYRFSDYRRTCLITEELAFRGYLITRLSKLGRMKALLYSSVLFGIWHIPPSILLLGSGVTRTAIYAVNIFLLGILFSYLFLESGSLIPSSIFHGVWNALEYTLFGYGNSQGVILGNSRILFDPEEGLVGTFVLLVFSIVVIWKIKKKHEK